VHQFVFFSAIYAVVRTVNTNVNMETSAYNTKPFFKDTVSW